LGGAKALGERIFRISNIKEYVKKRNNAKDRRLFATHVKLRHVVSRKFWGAGPHRQAGKVYQKNKSDAGTFLFGPHH
jgi:hypothetical protein